MKKLSPISAVASVLGTVCVVYYLACGIIESFMTPGLWIWITFGMILFAGVLWKVFAEPKITSCSLCRIYSFVKTALLSFTAVFLMIFLFFEGCVIKEWTEGSQNGGASADVVIVLGAAVDYDRPDDTLEKRILTAYRFVKRNPDAVIIACGGLGEDDIITEAECIKRELVSMGIEPGRIIAEDKSSSTTENFRYAASLLPDDHGNIAVITSGSHVFRAISAGEYIFDDLKITANLFPVAAPCPLVKLPCSMVREFAAFTKSLLSGNIAV